MVPHASLTRRTGKCFRSGISIASALSLVLLSGAAAYANNISGTYGQEGFWQPATQFNGFALGVASTHCNADELAAFSTIQSTTQGQFGCCWPSGIQMSRVNCTGSVSTSVDIRLLYLSDSAWHACNPLPCLHTTEAGGEEHAKPAKSAFCAMQGVRFPCGLHPSLVEINDNKYHNVYGSGAERQRELLHETGHSQGLDHHCNGDSIMNDGTCNGGRWLQITGYKPTDIAGVLNVYPGWPYN